jgi:hypothetical protein
MPAKKDIIYPFFLESCALATDSFWETIFEDLAYGKAPFGTYISKDFLCCGYKGKEFSYKIERKDSQLLYDEIYKLLTEKLGILSRKEKAQKKLTFHELEKNIQESRLLWNGIRKKNVKDTLYEKYALEMKDKHNLSYKECKYLLALIMLAITFKIITTKDITYKENRITNIDGIDFVQTDDNIQIVLKKIHTQKSMDSEDDFIEDDTKQLMADNWPVYLDSLRNNIR